MSFSHSVARKSTNSTTRITSPAATSEICYLFRCSLVETLIPLLTSKSFLRLAGAVVNMFHFTVSFLALRIYDIPLKVASNGRVFVCITEFPHEGFPSMADTRCEDDLDFAMSDDVQNTHNARQEELVKISTEDIYESCFHDTLVVRNRLNECQREVCDEVQDCESGMVWNIMIFKMTMRVS